MDRQLKALAEAYDAQVQALTTALETRRHALLSEGGQDPSVTKPERQSVGSFSAGIWERVNDPNAPTGGSSSAAQGAAPTEQARARMPPLPPPRTSGLYTGAAPTLLHSWERRRLEQQAEGTALAEADRTQEYQDLLNSRVSAAVAEALQQAETKRSPAKQSVDESWGDDKEADLNNLYARELKRTQIKLK